MKNNICSLSECPCGLFTTVEHGNIIGIKTNVKDQYGVPACYYINTGEPIVFEHLGQKRYSKGAYDDIMVMPKKLEQIELNLFAIVPKMD